MFGSVQAHSSVSERTQTFSPIEHHNNINDEISRLQQLCDVSAGSVPKFDRRRSSLSVYYDGYVAGPAAVRAGEPGRARERCARRGSDRRCPFISLRYAVCMPVIYDPVSSPFCFSRGLRVRLSFLSSDYLCKRRRPKTNRTDVDSRHTSTVTYTSSFCAWTSDTIYAWCLRST